MATGSRTADLEAGVLELHSGDLMTREEFHRLYQKMPEDLKAELVGDTLEQGFADK